MKFYNIARLKAQLSSILKEVVGGTEVVVTDHNKPMAKLVPYKRIPPAPKPTDEQLNQLMKMKPKSLKKGALSSVDLIRRLRDDDEDSDP